MKLFPSTSSMREPAARVMNNGAAPTDLNARTGLSTPPGIIACARVKRRAERDVVVANREWLTAHGGWSILHPPRSLSHRPRPSASSQQPSAPDTPPAPPGAAG